jgi:hypothetical protein
MSRMSAFVVLSIKVCSKMFITKTPNAFLLYINLYCPFSRVISEDIGIYWDIIFLVHPRINHFRKGIEHGQECSPLSRDPKGSPILSRGADYNSTYCIKYRLLGVRYVVTYTTFLYIKGVFKGI